MSTYTYHTFVICFHFWFYIFTVCDLYIQCSFISKIYLTFVSCCIYSVCMCGIYIVLYFLPFYVYWKKEGDFISKIMFRISSIPDVLYLFPGKLNLLRWYTDTIFFPSIFQEAVISGKGNKVFISFLLCIELCLLTLIVHLSFASICDFMFVVYMWSVYLMFCLYQCLFYLGYLVVYAVYVI